jgi:hypothetical protein
LKSSATWSLRERAVCRRPGGRADQLGQAGLHVHVDVLQRDLELEPAGLDLGQDGVEAADDRLDVGGRDDALGGQHPRMGLGPGDVLGVEAAVEPDRGVDLLHHRGVARGETPAPQRVGGGRCRAIIVVRVGHWFGLRKT